jgi:hypothetical protein
MTIADAQKYVAPCRNFAPEEIESRRTLSGKISALGCLGGPSFLERGVPSPTRLNPTRLAAEDIQLPLPECFDEDAEVLVVRLLELAGLEVVCLVEERVGDMKCGFLPSFSLDGTPLRVCDAIEVVELRGRALLALPVVSVSVPILLMGRTGCALCRWIRTVVVEDGDENESREINNNEAGSLTGRVESSTTSEVGSL